MAAAWASGNTLSQRAAERDQLALKQFYLHVASRLECDNSQQTLHMDFLCQVWEASVICHCEVNNQSWSWGRVPPHCHQACLLDYFKEEERAIWIKWERRIWSFRTDCKFYRNFSKKKKKIHFTILSPSIFLPSLFLAICLRNNLKKMVGRNSGPGFCRMYFISSLQTVAGVGKLWLC